MGAGGNCLRSEKEDVGNHLFEGGYKENNEENGWKL